MGVPWSERNAKVLQKAPSRVAEEVSDWERVNSRTSPHRQRHTKLQCYTA